MKIKARFVLCAALLLGLLSASPALAQSAGQSLPDNPAKASTRLTPVAVEHEGTDALGARLSTRLKELLNGSNLFSLDQQDKPKLRILLSSRSEFDSRPGVGSAYAVVWAFSLSEGTLRHYLAQDLGLITAEEIDQVAAKIVERTDGLAVRYGYLFSDQNN